MHTAINIVQDDPFAKWFNSKLKSRSSRTYSSGYLFREKISKTKKESSTPSLTLLHQILGLYLDHNP